MITQSGHYRLCNFDLTNHFEEDLIVIEKLDPLKPISAIYLDGEKKEYFVKRFLVEPSDKKVLFISEVEGSQLELVSTELLPTVEIKFAKNKGNEVPNQKIKLADFITVKGLKAKGNKLTMGKVKEINLIEQAEPLKPAVAAPKPEMEIDSERLERLKKIKSGLDDMDNQIELEF